MNVRLDVERVVLRDLELGPGGADALRAAMHGELLRLLADAPARFEPGAVPVLRAAPAQLDAGASPAQIGVSVARAVYRERRRMSERTAPVTESPAVDVTPTLAPVLQRTCSCGGHSIAGGECEQCRRKSLGVQAKLTVSRPGDAHEREAEQVADAVMRGPARLGPLLPQPEGVSRQADDEEEEELSARMEPGAPGQVPDDLRGRLDAQRGAGVPLAEPERAFFEPRLGRDLGGVRIHADAEAGSLARSLHAEAFTREQHVFFAPGRYQPHTAAGRRLLAHELTHTVQQRGGSDAVDRQAVAEVEPAPVASMTPEPPHDAAATLEPAPEPAPPAPTPAAPTPAAPRASESATDAAPSSTSGPAAAAPLTEAAAPQPPAGAEAAVGEAGAAVVDAPVLDSSSAGGLLQSLATVPPSAFASATTDAERAATELQTRERGELAASMPEIEPPTGLAARAERAAPQPTDVPAGSAPQPESPGQRESLPPETTHQAATGPLPAAQVETRVSEPADDAEGGGWWDWLFGAVRSFLRRLPTSDHTLDTSAGARPRVDTTGDADPAQNQQQRQRSDTEVAGRRRDADQATSGDFGEHDIYPDAAEGTLRPAYTPGSPRGPGGAGPREPGQIPEVVRSGVDRAGRGWLAGEVGTRVEQERAERRQYDTDSERERSATQRSIDAETARTRGEQQDARASVRREVSEQRDAWREENRRVQETYGETATTRGRETTSQIDAQVSGTETRADTELSRVEREAETKRRDTEREAADKKREAENRPRSFWQRVRGAVSDFFDALKGALNALFDAARRFVRGLIEGAKRLVRGWIEAARRAIVGLIRGFGVILKGVVSIALAAFPGAARRARGLIDRAVDGTVGVVNRAAGALQAFAQRALDALGAVLDGILAAYQAFYSALIDGLKFLAVGLIEILEKIGHLVEAAGLMPDHFVGQATEELMGANVDAPLPFELTQQPATPAAAVATAVSGGALPPADAAAVTSPTLSDENVTVDHVAPLELEPELLASLGLQDGEEREFGESSDPTRTLGAVQDDAAAASLGAEPSTAATTPEASSELPAANGPQAETPASEAEQPLTTEQRLDRMLEQEPDPPCPQEASSEQASQQSVPEAMKFGPLTRAQRASYLLRQMLKGVRNWLSCNWPWLLAAAIGVLTVLVIAEILTGGAITAALPPLMQLIGMIMLGVAAVRVAVHVGEYLSKGWSGDIAGAARSLARGLAIGAIELVFTLLFDLSAVLKAVRQGLTATLRTAAVTARQAGRTLARSATRIGRATVRTARAPGRAAALVGRAVVRRGRIVMRGVRQGFARGARSLDDLARRLWNTVRFRRFKLVRRGRRIQLWGNINPWVLLADGSVVEVATIPRQARLGDVVATPLGQGKVLALGQRLPQRLATRAAEGITRGSAQERQLFQLFDVPPRSSLRLDVPSAPNGRSYITYAFYEGDRIVYVGRASGVGNPRRVLAGRLGRGHDHMRAGLQPQVIGVHATKPASQGAEEFFHRGFQEQGHSLTNIDPPLSLRSDRRPASIRKIEAFLDELAGN